MSRAPKLLFNFIVLLALCFTYSNLFASTTLYKYIDKDGNVAYSDRKPADTNAEEIDVPEIQTYPAPGGSPDNIVEKKMEAGPGTTYTTIAFASPENKQSFHNQDAVSVELELEPQLSDGHLVQLLLDGQEVEPAGTQTDWQLYDVLRGAHTLQANIVSADGKPLQSGPSVTFYMHRSRVTPPPRTLPTTP